MTIAGIWLASSFGFLFGYIACAMVRGGTAASSVVAGPMNTERCRLCVIARRLAGH